MVPRGARAATATAPGWPSATSVAPSMAFSSTSSSGPSPVPTALPLSRGDCWCTRPSSPQTMRPRMGNRLRAAAMAVLGRVIGAVPVVPPHPAPGGQRRGLGAAHQAQPRVVGRFLLAAARYS